MVSGGAGSASGGRAFTQRQNGHVAPAYAIASAGRQVVSPHSFLRKHGPQERAVPRRRAPLYSGRNSREPFGVTDPPAGVRSVYSTLQLYCRK
mgnify:CR=1 FL=1